MSDVTKPGLAPGHSAEGLGNAAPATEGQRPTDSLPGNGFVSPSAIARSPVVFPDEKAGAGDVDVAKVVERVTQHLAGSQPS